MNTLMAWGLLGAFLSAQSFDVASVKPNTSGDSSSGASRLPGGRISITNNTVKDLIRNAYDVKPYQIAGGPGWMGSERYDVAAQAGGNASPDALRAMLKTLLADRFKLKLHREIRILPAYALVVAKDGPKLKKAGDGGSSLSVFRSRGQLSAKNASMAQLATSLSGLLDRPVLDMSRLTGAFDFDLQYEPFDAQPAGDSSRPSIFTGIEEQLGLKLDAHMSSVEVLVIDQAARPTEN